MKKLFLTLLLVVIYVHSTFSAWLPRNTISTFYGRTAAVTFVISNKIYVVGGIDSNFQSLNENWEYDPLTDSWTQKASYPVNTIVLGSTFVINNMGYIVAGASSSVNCDDVFAYEPNLNVWFPKNDFIGDPRYTACSFEINGTGYFGLGYSPLSNEFWSYNATTDSWTQVSSLPGLARQSASSFALNGNGYIGLGSYTNPPNYTALTDLWEYLPAFNSWIQKTSFPATARWAATVYTINNEAYVGCGVSATTNSGPATYYNDIWKYNPVSDSWSFSNYFPTTRSSAVSGVVNGVVYSGFGQNSGGIFSDWWADTTLANTGINQNSLDYKISIAPNPVINDLIVNVKDYNVGNSTGLVRILNIEGKLVSNIDVDFNLNPRIDVRKLSAGTYLCQLLNNKGQLIGSKKFIKERD